MLDRRVVGIVLAMLAVVAWYLLSNQERWRSEAVARTALARVTKGMALSKVEYLLNDAWHHARCPFSDEIFTRRLFFYGSQDLRHTAAIFVTAQGPPGEQVVTGRGRVEHYQLRQFDWCTRLDLSSL